MRRLAPFALLAFASLAHADPPRVLVTWPPEWPIDPAPVTSESWPRLPVIEEGSPATSTSAIIVATLRRIQATQRDAAYQHRRDVSERALRYRWDCSGMVSWVVAHTSPRAARTLGGDRVIARRVFDTILRAPTARPRRGWQRLLHIEDARPGDVFAWRTPRGSPSPHSGHTGFVLSRPARVEGLRDAYAIRIADSVVGPHEDDTRPEDTPGSLGFGVMVFLTDGRGQATHFGWHGTRTAGYWRTPVAFGRLD